MAFSWKALQPLFIAVTRKAAGPLAYLAAASACVAGAMFLWFLSGRIWFGPSSWIPWAMWIGMLYPNLVYLHVRMYRREPLFCLLTAASLYFLNKAWISNRLRPCLMAGLALGLTILTKSVWLPFLPVLAVLWLAARKRDVLRLALVLGASALVVAPWTFRNVRVLRSPVMVASLGGLGFMLNHIHGMDVWLDRHAWVYRDIPAGIADDEGAVDRLIFRRKLGVLVGEPGLALRIVLVNALHTFYPVMDAYYSTPEDNTARFHPGLLFAYVGIGIGLWRRRLRPPSLTSPLILPLAMGAVYLLVCMVFQGSPTYRLPMEPVLLATGCWGWAGWLRDGSATRIRSVLVVYALAWAVHAVVTIPVRKAVTDFVWQVLKGMH